MVIVWSFEISFEHISRHIVSQLMLTVSELHVHFYAHDTAHNFKGH